MPTRRHLVLTFEKTDGTPLSAADVLQAEGAVTIEGQKASAASEGLTANLSEIAYERAVPEANLKTLLSRHRVAAVKPAGDHILLSVEPLYTRADDLKIKISDSAGNPATSCSIGLDVPAERRLGTGWEKAAQSRKNAGLTYLSTGSDYVLEMPWGLSASELLIATEPAGNAARIFSAAPNCLLEAKPDVASSEIKSETISRALARTGPILIAIVSAGSNLASALPSSADNFWSEALDLIESVSSQAWEKKILARAQAPGVAADTKVLAHGDSAKPLAGGQEERASQIKTLVEASSVKAGPLSILQAQPVERYQIDVVLKAIRKQAQLLAVQSAGEESLLILIGGVRSGTSDFCERAMKGDGDDPRPPKWVKDTKRAFIIEIWDDSAVSSLRDYHRIEGVQDAPAGLYRCKIGGRDGEKIKLFGVTVATIADRTSRNSVFEYLNLQASTFLKP